LIKKSADTNKKIDLLNKMIQDKFGSIRNELSAVTRPKSEPQNCCNDPVDNDSSQKEENNLTFSHSNRHPSRDAPPHQTHNNNRVRKSFVSSEEPKYYNPFMQSNTPPVKNCYPHPPNSNPRTQRKSNEEADFIRNSTPYTAVW
jgi:hypothetical protein